MEKYCQESIPLVSVNDKQQYVLNEKTLDFIHSIPPPLGVISVAGLYRTGKSYLLNRMLLNRSSGFGVGPTVNPCTKGLWIWGTPIKGVSETGQSINVLIIDTEGIGALDQDQTHDTRIFTLAILLSSAFIYNSQGSIDENAIQNLSLVVNLTKHISIRTHDEQIDPDEFAYYFPSFFWVVRDFSLQLVDNMGETITQKEYLQRALGQQKGISDDIQQKNRIRRLLTSFFKQRQCFTLVRPLVNQQNLQNLDKLDLNHLRGQFVQQVVNLRKRILNKMKPKTLKGRKLNGQMYVALVRSYVDAINKGAVPNIENAWYYMCRQQCDKTCNEAYDVFQYRLKEQLKFPISEMILNKVIREGKQLAYNLFKDKAMGENMQQFVQMLKSKIKKKCLMVRQRNINQSQNTILSTFQKEISPIDKKIKNKEFKDFNEFIYQIEKFITYICEQRFSHLPRVKQVCFKQISKCITNGSMQFLRNTYSELLKVNDDKQAYKNRLQSQRSQAKQKLQKNKNQLNSKLSNLNHDKGQLQYNLKKIKNQYDQLSNKTTKKINYLQKEVKTKEEDLERSRSQARAKIKSLEEVIKSHQNSRFQNQAEFSKQVSLKQQQIRLLQGEIQQFKKKQNYLDSQLNTNRTQFTNQMRRQKDEFQQKINKLHNNLKRTQESNAEIEESYDSLKKIYQTQKVEWEEEIKVIRVDLKKKMAEIEKMERQKSTEMQKLNVFNESQKNRLLSQNQNLKFTNNNLQQDLDQLTQKFTTKSSQAKKEISILQQNIFLLKDQITGIKKKHQQDKKSFSETITHLNQCNDRIKLQIEREKILQLEQKFQAQRKQMQTTYQQRIDEQISINEQLNKNNQTLEVQLKRLQQIKQQQSNFSANKIAQLQDLRSRLQQRLSQQKKKLQTQFEKKEQFHLSNIRRLQSQMQELKEQQQGVMRQKQSKWQETFTQLKSYYQLELEKQEQSMLNQRSRKQKHYNTLLEQQQATYKDQICQLQMQKQQLQQDYNQMQVTYKNEMVSLQSSIEQKIKEYEILDKMYVDGKQAWEQKQRNYQYNFENVINEKKTIEQNLSSANASLKAQLVHERQQKIQLQQCKDNCERMIENKDLAHTQLKKHFEIAKAHWEKKQEEQRIKHQREHHQLTQTNSHLDKELALMKMEKGYNQKKIQELERSQIELTKNYEEKLKRLEQKINQQKRIQLQRISSEKSQLQQKHYTLKKTFKQNQSMFQKKIIDLQKQIGIFQQKIRSYEERIRHTQQNSHTRIQGLNHQIRSLKDSLQLQKKNSKQQAQINRKKLKQVQNAKVQVQTSYDRDKTLLIQKNNFLSLKLQQAKQQNSKNNMSYHKNLEAFRNQKDFERKEFDQYKKKFEKDFDEKYAKRELQFKAKLQREKKEYQNKISKLESEAKQNFMKHVSGTTSLMQGKVNFQTRIKDLTSQTEKQSILIKEQQMKYEKQLKKIQELHSKQKEKMILTNKKHEVKINQLHQSKQNSLINNQKQMAQKQLLYYKNVLDIQFKPEDQVKDKRIQKLNAQVNKPKQRNERRNSVMKREHSTLNLSKNMGQMLQKKYQFSLLTDRDKDRSKCSEDSNKQNIQKSFHQIINDK